MVKLAMNESIRTSDDEQGINKLRPYPKNSRYELHMY